MATVFFLFLVGFDQFMREYPHLCVIGGAAECGEQQSLNSVSISSLQYPSSSSSLHLNTSSLSSLNEQEEEGPFMINSLLKIKQLNLSDQNLGKISCYSKAKSLDQILAAEESAGRFYTNDDDDDSPYSSISSSSFSAPSSNSNTPSDEVVDIVGSCASQNFDCYRNSEEMHLLCDDNKRVKHSKRHMLRNSRCPPLLTSIDCEAADSLDTVAANEQDYKAIIQQIGKFPVEIIPYLFLGNAKNSADLETLNRYGIRYIVNTTPNLPNVFEDREEFKYIQIPITDHWSQNIASYFNAAIAFIGKFTVSLPYLCTLCVQ